MKYVPHAWGVTIGGILLTIRGLVTGSLLVNIIGDVVAVVGMVWLFYAWDKLMIHVKAEKRRERRVDKLEVACGNTDMIARAADQKADEARMAASRSRSQIIKGKLNRNGQIYEFERKEA